VLWFRPSLALIASLEGEEIKVERSKKISKYLVWIFVSDQPMPIIAGPDEIQTSESVTTMGSKMQHPGKRTVDN
jgi:hypothetical protein